KITIEKLDKKLITDYFAKVVNDEDNEEFIKSACAKIFTLTRELATRGYTIPYIKGYRKLVIKEISDINGNNAKLYENDIVYDKEIKISGHLEMIEDNGNEHSRPLIELANKIKALNNNSSDINIEHETDNEDITTQITPNMSNKRFAGSQNIICDALINIKDADNILLDRAKKWKMDTEKCVQIGTTNEMILHVVKKIKDIENLQEAKPVYAIIYYYNLYVIYNKFKDILSKDLAFKKLIASNRTEKTIIFYILKQILGKNDYEFSKSFKKAERVYFILSCYGLASALILDKKCSVSNIYRLSGPYWQKFTQEANQFIEDPPYKISMLPENLQNMYLDINKFDLQSSWDSIRQTVIDYFKPKYKSIERYVDNIKKISK
ncbi:hypothetical protein CONCODRAFT_5750, partial [Conidiobolus coronatus NRRL 28638]